MIMILCQVLLYIQADEVKNRKKQRKVETEVLPQDTVGKQQYKLNIKDNTILTQTKKLIFVKVADLRLKLATVQSKNIVLSNREIRLLRYVVIMVMLMIS